MKNKVIHIPERGCHNCRLHYVNHKECDSPYPCKQGMEWRPRVWPIKELTDDEIDEEEYHEIHDDINEARRNGEIE